MDFAQQECSLHWKAADRVLWWKTAMGGRVVSLNTKINRLPWHSRGRPVSALRQCQPTNDDPCPASGERKKITLKSAHGKFLEHNSDDQPPSKVPVFGENVVNNSCCQKAVHTWMSLSGVRLRPKFPTCSVTSCLNSCSLTSSSAKKKYRLFVQWN